jgi:hypothetical protein
MIAVIVAAGLLSVSSGWGVIVIAVSLPCLALIGTQWLAFRGHRHVAAFGFWVPAILANTLYIACCIAPDRYLLGRLFLGWLVIVVPSIAGLGTSWAMLATREGAVPRLSRPAAGFTIFVLAVLPVLMLWTFWPLHLAFLMARPTLELVADQVAVGQAVGFPRRAGLFQVLGSAVDPISGSVGLMIDPNPIGATGFVRVHPGTAPDQRGPIVGSELDVNLGGRWWYREDD